MVSLEEFKRVRVRSFKEVYALVDERMRSITDRSVGARRLVGDEKIRRVLTAKLRVSCETVREELERVEEAVSLVKSMGEFYAKLFELYTRLDLDALLGKLRRSRRLAGRIEEDYASRLKSARTRREAVASFREGLGRCLSTYKRLNRDVLRVKQGVAELAKMPSVKGDYVVVIAGMPQVGKSTLLSKLTRAKPEIGMFPFTTKTIIVGHWQSEYGTVVFVDTPGILDRPVDEMNEIELKAVYAVKYLADAAIYVFDANPNSYYSLEQQLKTYNTVRSLLGDKPVIAVLNKVDALREDELEKLARELGEKVPGGLVRVSALKELNLDYLKRVVLERLTAGRRPP
ncbi:GTPase [Thermogladius sp. KZ2Tp1]|uniref:NOG1 family protein n=1 Tax=Thermogladius sp. KZ2Tp1 TaxID=3136289 RepID=UPI003DA9A7B8